MKKILLVFVMIAAALSVLAQESNCGDGIDNDGDGFIDCFDSNCANSVVCKDFYVGRDKLCQVPPTGVAKFEMKIGAKSPDRTTWTSGTMVVGDLDNDGIPEVVTLHQDNKKIYILDGRDLSIKYPLGGTITGTAEYFDHTIGNVKRDNCGDIFIAEKDGGTFYISSYDCKGVQQWRVPIYGQPITMGLADFDEDGKVELYYRNEILDAETGLRLVKGSGTWTTIDAGPVAVDILDDAACTNCAGLELVLGGNIYAVNLGARTLDAGALSLAASIPAGANYFPKLTSFGWVSSLTSVADYNQDGSLDVLMSGATGSTGGATTVFFWDVKNSTYKTYQPPNNWQHGTGRLNIADIDGDGKSNATFVSGNRLYALKEDFTPLWPAISVSINEGTSGYTSTTVFDFNNDKAVEIVYRDEAYLYIINGKTGSVFTQATCRSRTANDYPVVADVDGDGSTEICVICATNDTDNINDIARAPYGQVRTYKSNLEAWVPARKVWNQHGYFNVNVNDDLTIPKIQQKHHLVFSTGSCTTGANRALNTFLNQSPFLDTKGCPTYASPDITYDASSVVITPPTCPDQGFTISMNIKNIGDLGLSGILPITFYQGNPTQAGAVKLNTVNINLTKFNVNDVVSLSNMTVQGTGATFTLYAVLNDNGSTVPTPIKLPNSTFTECNYTNNIVSASVTPTPFTIQTAKISDDFKCGSNPVPSNGAAEVYRLVGSAKETVGYTFYWFDSPTVGDTAQAVFKGPVRTGLAAGTYSIIAYHKGVKCGSTSAQVVIGQQTKVLTAAITENAPYTSCKNPDGKLTVSINGGDPFGNYTYEWFEGNVFGTSPILSKSHVITNVSNVTYSVLVTDKSTGCQILSSAKVTDNTVKPVVTASVTPANCNPANSGSASAKVGNVTNGYDFYWYNGSFVKPTSDFSGSTYSSISAGDYTVVAIQKSTGCSSTPVVATVVSKAIVPVTASVTSHQTSCGTPTGAASALVSGSTAGYTFKWFKGNNTLAANLIGSSSTIAGVAAGVYTVEATNTSNGCIDTEIVTINDTYANPVVAAATNTPNTNCTGITPNGLITINIDGVAPVAGQYTVQWFEGNGTTTTLGTTVGSVTGVSNITAQGLSAGTYTVRVADIVAPSNGCSTTTTFTITNNLAVVTIDNADIALVHQSNCSPVNGLATVNEITVNGTGAGNTTGYTFKWLQSNGTTVIPGSGSAATIGVPLAAGSYFVQATNTATNCKSANAPFTINDTHVNPVVAAAATVNNTNCTGVTPNGSITINIGGAAPAAGQFNVQWFEGNGTTTALGTTVGSVTGVSNITAQGLSAGTYTVRVTDLVTPNNGCSTTTTFTITNTPAVVTIDNADITLGHQSNCSPVNGSATVNEITVNGTGLGNTTGYTFKWLQSNGTTVIPSSGSAAAIAVPLAAGNYFVQATNTTTNCKSANTPFTINDTHVNPTVAAAATVNNTNCTGVTPNGSITINIGGAAPAAGQFNVEWFEGNGTTTTLGTTVGSVTGVSNITAQALSAGTYTVRVTDLVTPNTGCSVTSTFTITNTPAAVTVVNADISLVHQTNCNSGNGSATVNEITVNGTGLGNTTGYTFTWFQSNGTTVIPGSGSAAIIAVPLAAGSYFVQATNATTNCKSPNTPFTINDVHVNPVVTAATTINNTNCTGATPNGSITININAAAPVAGQHNIEWFEGNGTTVTLGTTVGSVTGAVNQTAQNLKAGSYTVRVTDLITPNTGCSTTTTFTITDTPAVVSIDNADIVLTHQSNCTPVNGLATVNEITVGGTGIGNTTGYTFTWYQSNGTTVIPGSGTAAMVGVPLAAGTYFVKATSTTTNCSSAITTFTINDTHVNPAVTAATTVNNTNCTGATPNGSVTINIGGVAPVAGQHNIEWFEGNGTTVTLGTTVGSVTGAVNQTAQNLKAGSYTVRVTDLVTPNTGCSTTTTFTITDTPAVVTIDNADIVLTHQSNCTPVNGLATVNEITVGGTGIGSATGYTFTWYQSNGTTVIPGSGTAATVGVPLAAGTYFVKATSTTTNCSSAITTFTINDTHVNPAVTAATTVNNTNCTGATPNGSVTINIGGVAPVAGQHNIEWFEGNGTTVTLGTTVGSVTGAVNQTAQNLKAGSYTVRVTDLVTPNTGCSTTTTFTITDTPAVVTIDNADIVLTHQSNCTPVNGLATVNEITVGGTGIGNTTGYTFTWYQSNGTTVIPGSGTAATVGVPLAAGTYFVKATSTTTNCSSAITTFTINDTHVNPAVTAATTVNNTNCTGATPNGSVTINIGGVAPVAGQHNIEWFEGNGTTVTLGTTVGSVTGAVNQTAQNLKAGSYTVRVTDLVTPNTGCSTTTTFTITDTPAVVTIDNADIVLTHQSNCTPVNGLATVNEITVGGTGIGSATGYTFTWYQSNGTTVIPGSGTAATVGVPLAAGTYFVKATSTTTNCSSAITTFTINDTHVNPAVTAATTVNNTNCTGATPNGSVTINIGGVAPVAGQHNIEWFEGNGTTVTLGTTVGSVTGAVNQTAQNLKAGSYTVRVTDLVTPNTGCSTTTTFTITDTPAVVTIDNADIVLTHQSNCTPVNGLATVNEITVGGTGIGNTTGYTFTWYQSNGTTVIPGSGTAATVGVPLAAGTYFVKATSTTTNCSSAITTFTINDTHVNPAVTAATTVNNTNCTGATPNGSVTINIGGVAPVAGQHNIEWFEGNGTTVTLGTTVGSVTGAVNQTAQNLKAGSYTVRVTDLVTPNTGCSTTTTFTITDTPAVVTIDNADIVLTHQSNCTPVNGLATVNEITVGGTGIGSATGYTFTWYQSNGTTVIPGSGTTPTVGVALAAGTYFVKATNTTTNCSSAITTFTINDTHVNPAITLFASVNNTNCTGVAPNGSMTIQINGGANPVTDFTIDWFEGNGTTIPLGTTVGATAGVNNETAQAILGGTYTVRVRDNVTPNSGCSFTASFTIGDNLSYPVPSGTPTANTACDPTKSNGSIVADVGGTIVNYTFHIFRGQNTLPANEVPINPLTATAGNLAAGIYTVQAITDATGCSATTEVTVVNNIVLPTIDNTATTNVNSCSTPDGTASVTAVSIGILADYTFSWYRGNNLKAVADYTGSTITGLLAGNYTVTATNNVLGCDVQVPVTVTVKNDPSTLITINHLTAERIIPAVCNSGAGQLGVEASSPANLSGFTFSWYEGDKNVGMTNFLGNGVNFAPPSYGNRISGIASGLHTVIALDNTSGCQDSLSINLPYSNEAAIVNLLPSPQTICDNPNGIIRTTVSPSAGTIAAVAPLVIDQSWYDIRVYQNGVLLQTVPGDNSPALFTEVKDLKAGNYTVIAYENHPSLNGCASQPNDTTVLDNTVHPLVIPDVTVDNKNCIGAPGTGSISLNVDGVATPGSGYTYIWHDGQLTSDLVLPVPNAPAPGHTALGLDGGFYTIEVTNTADGCASDTTFHIDNDPYVISIDPTDLTIIDQTDCSPGNGDATVTDVLIDGSSSGGTVGFTFEWFLNDGSTNIPLSSVNANVGTPIAADNYFVKATNTASNCTSPLVQFIVDDASVKPLITQNTIINNTNCTGAPSNGTITIDVDGGAPAVTDFTIQWYTGIGTTSPIVGATAATLANLSAGDYTVEVTDILSPGNTCSSISTFTIVDDLPVFTIDAASITVTDQTDCVANGSAQITDVLIDGVSNGGTAGFTFAWFDDAGAPLAGSGTGAIVGVALSGPASYRVVATSTTSLCSSTVAVFTVDDVSVTPVITQNTIINNTNCTGAPSNGTITIDVDGGAPAVTDFTIQWYTGIGTTSPIVGATAATLANLSAGDYTVEVTDILSPGNTCSSISTFTIVDDLPVFTIDAASITVTDQTDCVANGSAQITDVLIDGVSNGGTAGFTFAWFDDAGAPLAGSGTGAIVGVALSGPASYRVVATSTTSLCSSTVAVFTVDDVSVTPVITQNTIINNTNCTGAPSNGTITIDVDGGAPAVTDFTIQWYTGIGTTSPIVGATAATLANLSAGDYTVEVTDILSPGNTCSSISTFTIVDDLPVFTIDAASITVTDQTDCVANGSAQITDVLIDGVSNGGTAGFTFAWFDDAGAPLAGSGTGAIVGVALSGPASYRVVATSTTSLCSSTVAVFTVDDVSVTPVITQNTIINNTNCTGALSNGTITIDVDGGAPAVTDFTIQWYTGIGTTSPIVGATAATLANLSAGDYTVEVIDILSPGNTCSSIATFTIVDDLPVFTIDAASITVTDQTDCVANGSAEVTDILIDGVSNSGTTGFTFEWFDDSGVSIDGPGASAVVGVPLAAGTYRVVATNTTSLCSSSVTLFTVNDVSVTPVITQNTITNNTNCTGAPSNGSITIDVNGGVPAATDFTIQWYSGIGTSSPIASATTATLANLAAGDYTVEVTDILSPGNTCSSIATFTIVDDLPVFAINSAAITVGNQTDCVPNGSAEVTDILIDGVSNSGTTGFTFEWFDDAGTSIDGPGASDVVGVSLAAGTYRVVATNTTSLCSSSVTLFTVNDVSVTPVITQNTITNNTNCTGAPSNGSITIDVNGGVPAATDFTIQWYSGIGTSSPIVGATSETLANLGAGDHTVEVTDILSPGNTCSSIATFTIVDDLPLFAINSAAITVGNQTDCVANGSAEVTDILIDGVSNSGTTGFTFEWFDDAGTSIDGPGASDVVGVSLAAGTYRVVATNTTSLCSSSVTLFTVNDVSVTPVITQNTITNNTNCTGAPSNGTITIDVNGGVPSATDFTIQWYSGIGTSSPIVGATSETLANLGAGDYTVEVTDILSPGNTCSSIATFTIVDDLPVFTIDAASITVTDQTDCVANGSAEVTDILIDGVSNSGTTGFTFEWFDDSGVSIDGPGASAVVGVPLAAGNYRVVATNTTSLCSSSVTLFTVNDVSVTPVITPNTITNNTNCTGAPSNGTITIDVDGGAPAVTDFTIQWYTGIGTTSPIVGATAATLANLSAGDYTVEVTDILSPGNTCSSTSTFTIVDDLPLFTINSASITVGNQTDCVANGSAEVTDILIDGVSNSGTTGFTFEWFDDAGTSIDGPGASDVVGVSLAAGTYRVVATNTTSLCSSSVTLFTVNDVSVTPVITQNTITNNTNCTGAPSNGSITIDVNGGVPAATDFTIQWYSGTGTSSPIASATTATLANLAAGDYTVEVTDIFSPGNTCSSTSTFTVIETPNIVGINSNDIATIDNSDCQSVTGSASVTDIIFNGLPVGNTTGYVFEWLQSDLTPVDPGNGPTVGVNLIANDYYVRTTHVASNCVSPLTPFSIKDVTVIPVVLAIKDFDNIACNTNYTGQLRASVSEGSTSGVTAGYTFEWFSGINNTNAADFISSGPVLSGMAEGDYTVRVTDSSTPSANCANTSTLTIERKIPVFNGALTANAQTMCMPIQDGNMTVNSIQQFLGGATTSFDMSNAVDRNKFSFQWFDESLASIAPVSNGNNISPNLEEGTFYVQISDALGCTSDYIIGVIDDQTAKPQIALDEFKNPAVCILPEVNGSLSVSSDNNSNFADYTFEWFEGNNTTGTLVEPNSPFLANINYTGVLEYTTRVTNNTTQCFSLETYKFKTDTVAIQVVASAVPLTSCVTDNGSLFAATRTGSGQLYTIEWHSGSVIDTTPDFTSNEVLIAPIGTYIAVAKHPTLNFCTSIPDTVAVTDGRLYPQVTVMQKAPLTYCDPGKPNGVAFATVNGSVIGYTFDWYEGSATNSTYTGSEAGILKASTYVVKATDVISGCVGTSNITIGNDPLAIPVPQITLLSDRTDCEILDGSLSADVHGVTKDHIFNWYNGSGVKNQVDASGEIYDALDVGVYTVTATDRASGCTSMPVQREIMSAMLYPDFEIITGNTNCNENIGSASIKLSGDVEVKEVEWDIQGAIEIGPQASGLPSGVFAVTVISFKNCKTPKTFEIKTDISIYNGISRNSDGLNDFFEVGCIGEYPNNSVRIYNRAGSLVFEASGYDNEDIYFDGISNRGVNILGNDLPDGTYFYIINKGDGSEPKTGYLELLH